MRADLLIYCYGAVCIAMIFFNFLCILIFSGRERRELRQSGQFKEWLTKDALRREKGELPNPKEYRSLTRKLLRVADLSAFDRTLGAYFAEDPEGAKRYIKELRPVIFTLCSAYLKKEDVKAVYFLSFLNKYSICRMEEYEGLTAIIMEYFKKPLLYCSLHALDALCISGHTKAVMQGLRSLDRKNTYIYSKLIVKGLRSFTGDRTALSAALSEDFWHFSLPFQTAFMDWFSTLDGEKNGFILSLLSDETQDEELRYAAIRYFGRKKFEDAYPLLCKFALSEDPTEWVYASLAATALSAYGNGNTVAVLKRALSARNYHVRCNAIASLEKLGITYNELADILTGDDRFAKEMVTYQAERRSLRERQVHST